MNRGPISEVLDLIVGAAPVDLQTAALNGRWVSPKGAGGMNAILIAAIGTAGDDPVISLEQAQDASGTGAKVLHIKQVSYKVGATGLVAAQDLWQEVASIDRDNAVTSFDSESINGAENELILSVGIRETDLDINNGFTHLRLNCADVGGNAQLGAILYIPWDRVYKGEHNASLLA